MSVRVLVNGAFGRMGQVAVQAIGTAPELELAGKIGRTDDLKSAIRENTPDVVLDLTTATVVFANTMTIIAEGVRPVIGTSGLLQKQIAEVRQLCDQQRLGALVVPNFSISAILMMKYAQNAAKYLPHVEIIELHHNGKEDSPSGSALRTAELIAESRRETPLSAQQHEVIPGGRGANYQGIPIHSIRLPGLVAHQEVLFGGSGQTLTIRCDMTSRDSFVPGICLACKEVMLLDTLCYGLEHVMQ